MDFLKNIIAKINGSPMLRSICIYLLGLVIIGFVMSILLNLFSRHNSYITVPQFSGMTMSEAEKLADRTGLTLEVNDSIFVAGSTPGEIVDQIPSEGREVKSGRRIFITINAHTRKMVEIPFVTGFSLRQAKNNIVSAGLEIARIIYQPDIATNNVLEQMYRGTKIKRGSKIQAEMGSGVTLIVGRSEKAGACKVPKLVGYSLSEAKNRLWEVGLNVGKIDMDDDVNDSNINSADVYVQTPEQGSYTGLGSDVSVKLTLDADKVAKGVKSSDSASRQFKAPPAVVEDSLSNDIIVE